MILLDRRLSEWERLDRAREVAARDVAAAQDEIDKLERQLDMIDSSGGSIVDRDHFSRRHSGALVKLRNATARLHEAEAAQAAHEATLARFQPPEPEPDESELVLGDELTETIEDIKRQLDEPA